MIVSKNCSVINISLGYDALTFNASRNCKAALNTLDEVSTSISNFLQVLIDQGYQFVICKAAGNQNAVGGGNKYKYYLKDTFDEDSEWMYYSQSDYEDFLDGKADEDCKQYFERHSNDLDVRIADGGCLDDGNVDARYDVLGAITNEDVKDRIVIVGAVENLGTHYKGGFLWFGRTKVHDGYKIADFSQCGDQVDVLAPGVDIQSTIRNGYGFMSGTSMAAPHVTGVLGLVFSANSNMTGSGAKEIIVNSATGSYGNENYGIVNAGKAVDLALAYEPETIEDNVSGEFDEADVPVGAVEFNGHYYYVYDVDSVGNWNDAKQYCVDHGGYLATITSAAEDAFLYDYVTSHGYATVLFGLTDQERSNDWTWVTGEEFSYQNWHNGEPNHQGNYEHYGMYYSLNTDGTWNDGSGLGGPFICEWGEYTLDSAAPGETVSGERNIVLVLDVSGSMFGTPIEETQKASINFVETILEEDASIGVVTYENSAYRNSDFSTNKNSLEDIISSISSGGETNISAGLAEAYSMLENSGTKKIIVLMSDGEPNRGLEGEDLIAYADAIKDSGVIIYTLGFFENLGDEKSSAQQLMERIASDGCHYEVADAEDLVFFFGDMADQINGQKYIYVRIACPVDVSVTYQGQTLNSAEDDLSLRTDFGTLTFEETDEETGTDDRVKVLRLKEGVDYDLELTGTGHGIMNYTIGFMDDNGDYSDLRRFENVKITRKTKIDTVASSNSSETTMDIDEDGDGKYDLKLRAEADGYGEEVREWEWIPYAGGGAAALILIVAAVMIIRRVRRKRKVSD